MQVAGSPHGKEQPLATFSSGKEPNGRDVWDVPRPRYSGSCSCSPPYGSRLSPAHCCIVQGTAVWGGRGGEGDGDGGATVAARIPGYLSTLGTWAGRWQGSRQVARTPPFLKRGWVCLALVLVLWPRSARAFLCSSALAICGPAGSPGLLGEPVGPPNRTKQPVNISVRGARIPLPGPVSCFKSHVRYLLHDFYFASSVSRRIMSAREETPRVAHVRYIRPVNAVKMTVS